VWQILIEVRSYPLPFRMDNNTTKYSRFEYRVEMTNVLCPPPRALRVVSCLVVCHVPRVVSCVATCRPRTLLGSCVSGVVGSCTRPRRSSSSRGTGSFLTATGRRKRSGDPASSASTPCWYVRPSPALHHRRVTPTHTLLRTRTRPTTRHTPTGSWPELSLQVVVGLDGDPLRHHARLLPVRRTLGCLLTLLQISLLVSFVLLINFLFSCGGVFCVCARVCVCCGQDEDTGDLVEATIAPFGLNAGAESQTTSAYPHKERAVF
jgi:hypothetical protein